MHGHIACSAFLLFPSLTVRAFASAANVNAVRRNAKGGVFVNTQEIKQAFEFFDAGNKGYITIQDLREKLGVFDKSLSSRDYKFLMQNKVGGHWARVEKQVTCVFVVWCESLLIASGVASYRRVCCLVRELADRCPDAAATLLLNSVCSADILYQRSRLGNACFALFSSDRRR
jgi:hypothetical protein